MSQVENYSNIDFYESFLRIKTLENSIEKTKAYRLRHEAFATELGWVQSQVSGLEMDRYDDERMVPLGVFNGTNDLVAYLRITLPNFPFMMEHEKMATINEPLEKSNETIEISRVCTDVTARSALLDTGYGKFNVSMVLYKGLYQWCQINHIHKMYMVVESKLYRLLKMSGFPCRPVGDITIMPDGAKTVTVKVNWKNFELQNITKRPNLLTWFNSIESIERLTLGAYESNPLCNATATA